MRDSKDIVVENGAEVLLKTNAVWRRVLFEKPRSFVTRLMFVKQLHELSTSIRKFVKMTHSLDFDLPNEHQELRMCADSFVPIRGTMLRVLDDMEYTGQASDAFVQRIFIRLREANELLSDQEEAWRLALNGSFRRLVNHSVQLIVKDAHAEIAAGNKNANVSVDTANPAFRRLLAQGCNGISEVEDDLEHTMRVIQQDYTSAASATPIPGFEGTLWKYRNTAESPETRGTFRIIAHYQKSNHTLYPILLYPKMGGESVSAREIVETMKELEATLYGI